MIPTLPQERASAGFQVPDEVNSLHALNSNGSPFGMIVRKDGKFSLVEEEKLRFATEVGNGGAEIGAAFSLQPVPRIYPDMLLEAALKQFGPHPMLPVFNRADSDQALGTLHLEDVFRTYGVLPGRKDSWAEPEPAKLEEKAD